MMRPTRWTLLLAVAVVAAAVGYLVFSHVAGGLPRLSLLSLLWIVLLAAAEVSIALTTRARLAGRSGTRPINPFVVARLVALAKASSTIGSVVVGGYAGLLAWEAQQSSPAASDDTRIGAVGIGVSLLLVAAAVGLERVCRVKDDDDRR
jgi:hypothetical protein